MSVLSTKQKGQPRFLPGDHDAAATNGLTTDWAEHPAKAFQEQRRYIARLHYGIDQIADLWRAFEVDGACTAFQTFIWASHIRDHVLGPAGATMFVVEILEPSNSRPVMLLPLVRRRRFAHSVIEWLDLGVSDYAAPILAPGLVLTPNEIHAIWTAAREVMPSADVIDISRIPPQIFGTANPLISLSGCRPMEMESFGVVLNGEPETLIERLCRKSTYRDFAKFRRRLERHGAVHFISAESPGEIDRVFDALLEQRRRRFRDLGRVDLLTKDEIAAFYRDAAHHGLEGGSVRVFGLTIDGQCIATAYGLIHREAFHLLIQTMDGDEQWRKCSPGLQVTAEVLKWSLTQGLSYFDFTIGMLSYKLDFGAVSNQLFEFCEAQSARGYTIVRFTRAITATKAWLRRHPHLFKPLRDLRRALRRQINRLRGIGRRR
jgi:CelD/BcsL family acetyltransferase involved in cellulose biosynthesis